jgi:hypothetical protein
VDIQRDPFAWVADSVVIRSRSLIAYATLEPKTKSGGSPTERVMKIQELNNDLKSLRAPKSHEGVILLQRLTCERIDILNAELAAMNAKAELA